LLPLRKARNWGQIGPKSSRPGRKMPRTGRQPYATTDVLPFGTGTRRLRPPEGLSDAAKAAFLDLVTTCPADQFQPSDMPLLCRWAELTAMCEAASVELQAAGMLAPAGVGYSPWLRVYLDCTKALSNLALRLRIGPQSRAEGTAAAGWDDLVFRADGIGGRPR
jgi:phage terminase small subunit